MTTGPTEFEKKRIRHASGESTTSNDSISNYIPTPPDGGWGWVIVVASMLNNCIVDGIAFTFGVFYMEFVVYFGASKGKTAMAGSLLCGMYLCAGPIVSALANRFGCRPVTVFGGLLASLGFFLCSFCDDINLFIFTYGVLGGVGFGFIYLPSCVAVSYYFEKKRALATGLAVCGSGIGTFLFAPFGRYLLDTLDWKNAMMIISGITLNACVLGMLFRPLEPAKKIHRPREKNIIDRLIENSKIMKRNRSESECSANINSIKYQTAIMEKVREAKLTREKIIRDEESESEMSSMPSLYFHSLRGVNSLGKDGTPINSRQNSIQYSRQNSKGDSKLGTSKSPPIMTPSITINSAPPRITVGDSDMEMSPSTDSYIPSGVAVDGKQGNDSVKDGLDKIPDDVLDDTTYIEGPVEIPTKENDTNGTVPKNGHVPNGNGVTSETAPMLINGSAKKNGHLNHLKTEHTYCASAGQLLVKPNKPRKPKTRVEQIQKQDYAKPLYRKDIFLSGSVLNIPQFRSQPNVKSYVTSITTIPDSVAPEKESKCWSCVPKSAKDTLQMMLDISILKDPKFLIICLGNVLLFIGFYIPFVYISDFAIENNVSTTEAAWLISVIGIANTLGRVFMGWVADFPKVDPLLLHNIALLISGIATMLAPFCTTYVPLMIFAGVFGLCVATFISLTSIVLCNILGLEKLTNAFGMLTLFRGISSIVGPPIAGSIYDSTGGYTVSFLLGGGMLLLSGIMHLTLHLPCLKPPAPPKMDEVVPSPESDDEDVEMLPTKDNIV
ncbi:unnamed protein product [Owenia fusiformis]|uniref:Major facilitator superfamily (MFS) profile domain-containing protein n=1 Tax=Owenia fusiformis TaxID=6347 RepID=A0A8S4PVZ1_OWEFU|nr:unnamed protein product [Owenia fusiformis]